VRILVVNAGSSSLKLSVLDGERLVASAALVSAGGRLDSEGLTHFVRAAGTVEAVGHRIVHGGTEFTRPVRIDSGVRQRLDSLIDLAPLHQPISLAALDEVSGLVPGVPAVACFDTAFHATIPPAAATYALPAEWRIRWPLRRFGFHGLSHAYIARRAPELMDVSAAPLRIVSCHLGSGASVTAIVQGSSIDTTMGFTPLEGLVMATRSGTVDPGLVLWLEDHAGVPSTELADALENRSGLLGLAGSSDLQAVLQAESAGEPDAALAVEVYLHRLRAAIASMAAPMDGLDCLVFTGGVGEHAAPIRQRAAAGLGFLGVGIARSLNDEATADADISTAGTPVRTLVIEAREDLQIATEVRQAI